MNKIKSKLLSCLVNMFPCQHHGTKHLASEVIVLVWTDLISRPLALGQFSRQVVRPNVSCCLQLGQVCLSRFVSVELWLISGALRAVSTTSPPHTLPLLPISSPKPSFLAPLGSIGKQPGGIRAKQEPQKRSPHPLLPHRGCGQPA